MKQNKYKPNFCMNCPHSHYHHGHGESWYYCCHDNAPSDNHLDIDKTPEWCPLGLGESWLWKCPCCSTTFEKNEIEKMLIIVAENKSLTSDGILCIQFDSLISTLRSVYIKEIRPKNTIQKQQDQCALKGINDEKEKELLDTTTKDMSSGMGKE